MKKTLRCRRNNLLLKIFIRLHGVVKAWTVQNMGIGIQFIDTQKVNWEGYDEINITYTIEGKYLTFNSNALIKLDRID